MFSIPWVSWNPWQHDEDEDSTTHRNVSAYLPVSTYLIVSTYLPVSLHNSPEGSSQLHQRFSRTYLFHKSEEFLDQVGDYQRLLCILYFLYTMRRRNKAYVWWSTRFNSRTTKWILMKLGKPINRIKNMHRVKDNKQRNEIRGFMKCKDIQVYVQKYKSNVRV
jgi:hypothetical protein